MSHVCGLGRWVIVKASVREYWGWWVGEWYRSLCNHTFCTICTQCIISTFRCRFKIGLTYDIPKNDQMLPTGHRYAPLIVNIWSQCCPKVFSKLSQSSQNIQSKLSQSCLKIVTKLSKNSRNYLWHFIQIFSAYMNISQLPLAIYMNILREDEYLSVPDIDTVYS